MSLGEIDSMLRHRGVGLAALRFAVMLHLSRHLGRPGHDDRQALAVMLGALTLRHNSRPAA